MAKQGKTNRNQRVKQVSITQKVEKAVCHDLQKNSDWQQSGQFVRQKQDTQKANNTNNKGAEQQDFDKKSQGKRVQSADEVIENFGQVNYLQVSRHQHEQRLDNFLLARLKGLPRSHVYKLIRSDEVRVNNKRCKPHDKLYRGDVVRLAPIQLATREKPIISAEFAEGLKGRIVYEDDGLLVLNKPSGMAVHGGSGLDFGVIEAVREVLNKPYLELVHRIDKDTSGLLMIAKKRSVLKRLQQCLQDKVIQKHYLCLVAGEPIFDEQLIDVPLLRYTLANGERRVRVDVEGKDKQAKFSQTQIYVRGRFLLGSQKVGLVEALPLTGRTHQIRVHLAYLGHALLGDDKYYLEDNSGVRRLCLHAWRLDIPDYPEIIAPLPEDMQSLLPKGMLDTL